jgi:PAS domain S-box-containing protein
MPPLDDAFEQLFEHSSDPVLVMDPLEDRILEASNGACAMLGYTRAELLETPMSHIHPAEMPKLRAFVDRAIRDGEEQTIAVACRTRSGVFLPTEVTLLALRGPGRPYLIGFVTDRSEHRQPGADQG